MVLHLNSYHGGGARKVRISAIKVIDIQLQCAFSKLMAVIIKCKDIQAPIDHVASLPSFQ